MLPAFLQPSVGFGEGILERDTRNRIEHPKSGIQQAGLSTSLSTFGCNRKVETDGKPKGSATPFGSCFYHDDHEILEHPV